MVRKKKGHRQSAAEFGGLRQAVSIRTTILPGTKLRTRLGLTMFHASRCWLWSMSKNHVRGWTDATNAGRWPSRPLIINDAQL